MDLDFELEEVTTWLPDPPDHVAGDQHPFTSDSDSGATHSPYIAFVSVRGN